MNAFASPLGGWMLRAPEMLADVLPRARELDPSLDEAKVAVAMLRLDAIWDQLFPAEQSRIVKLMVEKVTLPKCRRPWMTGDNTDVVTVVAGVGAHGRTASLGLGGLKVSNGTLSRPAVGAEGWLHAATSGYSATAGSRRPDPSLCGASVN